MSNYTEPVNFTETDCGIDEVDWDEDDVLTVKEFIECCDDQGFTDYDGFGHSVKDKMCDPSIIIYPSQLYLIPKDATHIVWYNK